jgi:thiamine biosynthesis protein ThiI
MEPPGAETVVVRYGEMSTKSSRVRRSMERQLVTNLAAILADRDVEGDVERRPTRPLIHTDAASVGEAARAAAGTFGVVSASPALTASPELDHICDALADTARACYGGGTYAVNARRAGEDYDFDSRDIEQAGGSAVWEAVEAEFQPVVDLDDPDLTFEVEVREEQAFLYLEKIEGPGGLPVGTQQPVVALVSGGIDSPVAAYELMRKGCPILPVYIDLGQYGGPDHRARAVETVGTLRQYAPNFAEPIRVVPGGDTVEHIADTIDTGRMLVFRRFCYLVAEAIALEAGAKGIVTGESIGQKSSQTAQNMSVTSGVTDLPIHRPLLTLGKNEITERAKTIGTFRDSTIPAGCNRFAPAQAETNAHRDRLRELEPDDLRERAREAAADAELVDPDDV